MNDRYVILTGSKNNAGDFLIKYRAKQLFAALRSDREIIDWNVWDEFDEERLKFVNESRAVILLGGPALMKNMYPNKYKLHENLDKITAPIIALGIGWACERGDWSDINTYELSDSTHALLKKMDATGYYSSVRDYHTLQVLLNSGYKNVLMSGCPALYSLDHVDVNVKKDPSVKKIGFSLGVTMRHSETMFKQMQNVLLMLKRMFPESQVEAVFHHTIDPDYKKAQVSKAIHGIQKRYLDWLDANDFSYVDISGSAENLINYYSQVDMHIGYRVHAHIFMNSISKKSILLNEDGRGKALERVLGGMTFSAYDSINTSKLNKELSKLSRNFSRHKDNTYLIKDLENSIRYELKEGIKFLQPRSEIDRHFEIMQRFIKQLP
ncbi:MAG: polysaccharide pyruvyl transferase family protein [Campylobacterota bacterium]|nr:polysaccharide pyruvyl transferase family protein [Campylobacterota bacterium]